MMHQAYEVHSILKQGVHIESIAAYANNVILGARNGQLIMYSVKPNGSIDMLMFNQNSSKKPISQLEVVEPQELLFVLTDAMVHVCDMSRAEKNFSFIHSSVATKGCSLFALDVKNTLSTTGDSTTLIRICCAIKRTLQFFYWKVDKLESLKFSIDLKDVPKVLCWVDDLVCVGSKDEYVLYNIANYKLDKHDLIVTSSSQSIDPCVCLLTNNIFGVSKDNYLLPIDPSNFIKDDKRVPLNVESTLKPTLWSSPLLNLVWDEPYAIGQIHQTVEVRCLERSGISNNATLVQNIPELSKIRFLVRSGQGSIFAAAISELWHIRSVPIPEQRRQLLLQKKFQLAIELTQVSSETEEERSNTIRQIHTRYAKELFANKQFSAAMKEFELASADPYDVIRLFPTLHPNASQRVSTSDGSADAMSIPAVPIVPQLEDKDLENALLALTDFLCAVRPKEQAKLRDTASTSSPLLSIIDTTLLKCYVLTKESMVAPLLRLNQCYFSEAEKVLKKHKKIAELIILYNKNEKHHKALELLQAQAIAAENASGTENSSNYEAIISYLQDLGPAHLVDIFAFADWVLKRQPADGLRIFTQSTLEEEHLPRANVLDFLVTKHKALVIPYLEHIINEWKDTNTLMHNVLIKQYREKVQQLLKAASTSDDPTTKAELQQYRTKLYDILKNSDNYSPDVVLRDFPTNVLMEERALILGRLKKHEKVLAIYIQILGNVEMACTYCEEQSHDSDDESNHDIFLTLLKIILKPLKDPPYEDVELHPDFLVPNQDIVLDILNRYATKIDPDKIFPYLPDDMPLYRLSNYLDTVLRTQMARQHYMLIMEGLLGAEILRTTALIKEQTGKCFERTEQSICCECKKRFANESAFVRHPNGDVVHLSCYDRKSLSGATA